MNDEEFQKRLRKLLATAQAYYRANHRKIFQAPNLIKLLWTE